MSFPFDEDKSFLLNEDKLFLLDEDKPFSSWTLQGLYGAPTLLFENIESTHLYLHNHFRELVPGTLIIANSQTHGRGRHDRPWVSPVNKNLYFNLFIPLQGIRETYYSQITQIAAISLAQILKSYHIQVAVKWPNDLLWQGQKICGIISERIIHNQESFLSLGIGLNVNTDPSDLENIGRPATSLKIITQKTLNRSNLLQLFISKMEFALLKLKKEGFLPWKQEWLQMENFLGKKAQVVEFGKAISGSIYNINDDGSLLFQKEDGEIITIYAGDLEI